MALRCDVEGDPNAGRRIALYRNPEGAGDTMWANMYTAYDTLSGSMQAFLGGLTGVHDPLKGQQENIIATQGAEAYATMRKNLPLVEHPLVTVHPETGRRILYVNPLFLSHIKELAREEAMRCWATCSGTASNPNFTVVCAGNQTRSRSGTTVARCTRWSMITGPGGGRCTASRSKPPNGRWVWIVLDIN